MTEYRRRFQRDSRGAGMVLTARDVEIVVHCFEHQWLSRAQLQRLVGVAGVTRMNQRLRQLYDHQFLGRMRAGTIGAGLQPVYLAGEAAVPLLAERTGLTEAEVRAHLREDARASAALLPHDLQVNDVRIALTHAIHSGAHLRLDCWRNARDAFDAYNAGRALRPDGYFRFWEGDLLHSYFLEVDRGTANLTRWRAKVERYLDYLDNGFYTARHGLKRFRVMVTAPSPSRLHHLMRATAEVTSRNFCFALTDDVSAVRQLRQPLWRSVGSGVPEPLLRPVNTATGLGVNLEPDSCGARRGFVPAT